MVTLGGEVAEMQRCMLGVSAVEMEKVPASPDRPGVEW